MAARKKKTRKKAITFSNQVADDICEKLSNGMTLKEICALPDMPSADTIRVWVRDDVGGFRDKFNAANDMKYIAWEDECVEIADDASNDWMTRQKKDGTEEEVLNTEHIQRSKLRIDTRTKFMRARRPDLYSDKSAVEVAGPGGGPIKVQDMTMIERARLVGMLLKSGAIEKQRGHGAADDAGATPPELPAVIDGETG